MNTTTEKNTTNTNTENTNTTNNTEKKEGKNMNTENKNTNTTPATTTENKNSKRKEGKKMNTNTTEKHTNTTEKNTLPGNIKQAKDTLVGDMKALATLLNTPAEKGDKIAMLNTRINAKRAVVNKDLSVLNRMKATEYYKKTPLFDIIKNADNVPGYVIEEQENDGKYTLKLVACTVYPTLSGMKSAGVITDDTMNRVDALRRVVAYIKSGKTAGEYLTGNTTEKKDVPTARTTEIIENMGDISMNKARSLMKVVLHDLTGGEFKKEVMPVLYKEFESYITKRGKKWNERVIVGKATANDMILEFANMFFTGKTTFKYIAE